MKIYFFSLLLLFLTFAMGACKPKVDAQETSAGDVDATRFVVIGGAEMAGLMDDALYNDGQQNSLGALLSNQLELIGGSALNQNLMPSSSEGFSAQGNARFKLGYKTDCKNVTSLSPIRAAASGDGASFMANNYSSNAPYTNFGIPFLKAEQLSTVGIGNPALGAGNYNPYFARIASSQLAASVKGDILASNPTFFAFCPGFDEVLSYAAGGAKLGSLSDPTAFIGGVNDLVQGLTSNGAKGVLANIPDVTEFPYFNTIPYNGLVLDAANAQTLNDIYNPIGISFVVGANPFLIEDPSVGGFGVRKMVEGEKLLLSVPLDSVKCHKMGSLFPIRDEFILELSEINDLRTKIAGYNNAIATSVSNFNLAFVDAHSFYKSLTAGTIYNGVSMNTTFVSGGAYSLDGRNLTPRGNALFANKFIQAINSKYNSKIWELNATSYRGVIFP